MNSSDEHRLTQWIDGELSDDDVRDLLQQDSTLLELRDESRRHGESLRQHLQPTEIPYGDFFNNQIRQRAEAETRGQTQLSSATHSFVSILMNILTSPRWVAGLAMGAATLLMFTLIMASSGLNQGKNVADTKEGSPSGIVPLAAAQAGPKSYSEVVHAYTPRTGVTANPGYNESAGVTIIKIDGLKALPQTAMITGYFPASSERDVMVASTTLYDEDHKPILVVSTDSHGQPVFRSFAHH